jgi:predicted MFS family arabinose efflux permease
VGRVSRRDPDRLRSRTLLTLQLFGWLAGFYIVPEGLAAPYAHSLHGSTLTVGLLMAAMPFGTVVGAFLLGRIATPSARMRMMGWMAILSCIPLIGSAWNPPLWVRPAAVGPGRRGWRLYNRKPRVLRTGAC